MGNSEFTAEARRKAKSVVWLSRENSLKRHGRGNILGILRLDLSRFSPSISFRMTVGEGAYAIEILESAQGSKCEEISRG